MKRILLASAMILSAGAAMAEVKFSGTGEMGVVHDGKEAVFDSELNLKVTMSGETETGLSFGAMFDLDEAASANAGSAGSVYISGSFGRLSMGDELSASERMIGNLAEVGFSDLAKNDVRYLTGDGVNGTAPSVLYSHSVGKASFAASLSDGSNGVDEVSIAGRYNFGDYTVSAGYERADNGTTASTNTMIGADAKFGDASLKAFYGIGGDAADGMDQLGVGASYTMGDVGFSGMIRKDDMGAVDTVSYGLGASYDLGGGAMIKGGFADDDRKSSDPVADLGVTFKF